MSEQKDPKTKPKSKPKSKKPSDQVILTNKDVKGKRARASTSSSFLTAEEQAKKAEEQVRKAAYTLLHIANHGVPFIRKIPKPSDQSVKDGGDKEEKKEKARLVIDLNLPPPPSPEREVVSKEPEVAKTVSRKRSRGEDSEEEMWKNEAQRLVKELEKQDCQEGRLKAKVQQLEKELEKQKKISQANEQIRKLAVVNNKTRTQSTTNEAIVARSSNPQEHDHPPSADVVIPNLTNPAGPKRQRLIGNNQGHGNTPIVANKPPLPKPTRPKKQRPTPPFCNEQEYCSALGPTATLKEHQPPVLVIPDSPPSGSDATCCNGLHPHWPQNSAYNKTAPKAQTVNQAQDSLSPPLEWA